MTALLLYLLAGLTALNGYKILSSLEGAAQLNMPRRTLVFGALAGLCSLAGGAASFWLQSMLPAVYGLLIRKMMVCAQWASPGRGAVLIFLAQAGGVAGSAWIAWFLRDFGPLVEAAILGGVASAWLLIIWNIAIRHGFAPRVTG